MQIAVDSNIDNLLSQAAKKINLLFEKNKTKPVLFLTSGGSSFDILEYLEIPERIKLSIGVLDERYSTDPSVNNFTQLKKTQFFQRSEKLFEHILDTSVVEGENLEEFAERYESMLRAWMVENPNGVIIATIGMGPDGHTSGIMPFPEDPEGFEKLFDDARRLVVGYDAENKNQYRQRATTTFEFLRNIHHAIGYIVGEKKQEAWNRVLAGEGTLAVTPARILKDMEDVRVFTDLG